MSDSYTMERVELLLFLQCGRFRECGEDLLMDVSEVLFNELAFFKLMEDFKGYIECTCVACTFLYCAVGIPS